MLVADFDGEVYDALVNRGWEDGETITKEIAFDEFCNWHGLVNWGRSLRSAWASVVQAENDLAE